MRRISLLVPALVGSLVSLSQTLVPVNEGSTVKFKIKNFGFNVTGSFSGLQGNIRFNPDDLAACSFNVTVDAKTINTGIDMRDNHLRKSDYFDVEKYPQIRFESVKVTPSTKSGTLFIFGKLTIKNVTRDISFPFTAEPTGNGFLFKGAFTINRRDFGVGGGSTVGDKLTVTLLVEAKKG